MGEFCEYSEALKPINCDMSTQSKPLLSELILCKMDSDLHKKLEGFRSTQDNTAVHSLLEVAELITFLNTKCNQSEDAGLHISHKAKFSRSSPC